MVKGKFTAILVDDEPKAITYLCELLEEYSDIVIQGKFTNLQTAITEINKLKPDVLFLDVQMLGKSGFDVIKEVRSEEYTPYVIFITGYAKFAIRAIKYAAFDYLLKPVNPFELEVAITKVALENEQQSQLQNFDKLISEVENTRALKFNTSTGFIIIHPSEIIYLEASRNYCEIHLIDNRMELVTMNMSQVCNILQNPSFFRISRFHAVNLSFIQKVERSKKECYLLANGEKITLSISRSEIKELEQMFTPNSLK